MGRSLLILCAGALVVGTLTMGAVRRNTLEQDTRVSSFEADVIARENALSAMNQALSYVASRFDSLLAGYTLSHAPLTDRTLTVNGAGNGEEVTCAHGTANAERAVDDALLYTGSPIQSTLLCERFRGVKTVRFAKPGGLQLSGTAPRTLLPTRELHPSSLADASIRATGTGNLEITATGTYLVPRPGQAPEPRTYTVRRVYGKATAFDAALIAVAPYVTPSFSGTFEIDGRDINPTTLLPTGNTSRDRPGIKTNTQRIAQRFGGMLGVGNKPRVRGRRGNGDIAYGNLQPNLDAIFDEAFQYPAKVMLPDVVGNMNIGSAGSPAVVVAPASLTVEGILKGTGILVVDGNLQTYGNGQLQWDGVVMVRRDNDTDGGMSAVIGGTPSDLQVELGPASKIIGSLVVMQRSSALIMPFAARLKVTYVGSFGAGLISDVGVQHARDGEITDHTIAELASNRFGDALETYSTDLQEGEQANFFIDVHYPSWHLDPRLAGTVAYRNFARGHFSPVSGRPYGISHQTGDYKWWMAFEDIRDDFDMGFGPSDWDYDRTGTEDHIIEVTLQCRQYAPDGTLVTVMGVQQYEECTPANPDTRTSETALDWSGVTATSGVVAAPAIGTNLQLTLTDAKVFHSSLSIARLVPVLKSIRDQSQLVLLDSWTSM